MVQFNKHSINIEIFVNDNESPIDFWRMLLTDMVNLLKNEDKKVKDSQRDEAHYYFLSLLESMTPEENEVISIKTHNN